MMACFLQSKIASAHPSGVATERYGPTAAITAIAFLKFSQREEAPGDLNGDNALLRLDKRILLASLALRRTLA